VKQKEDGEACFSVNRSICGVQKYTIRDLNTGQLFALSQASHLDPDSPEAAEQQITDFASGKQLSLEEFDIALGLRLHQNHGVRISAHVTCLSARRHPTVGPMKTPIVYKTEGRISSHQHTDDQSHCIWHMLLPLSLSIPDLLRAACSVRSSSSILKISLKFLKLCLPRGVGIFLYLTLLRTQRISDPEATF